MAAAAPRSSGQRPRHLTPREKDVSRELPTKPPMNPVTGGTNQQAPPPPKTSPTSQKTSSKTPDQGSPRATSWGLSTPDRCWRPEAADQEDSYSANGLVLDA
ncbi:hypothetical protein MTO96_051741 [Rhipicephalus appendiculatus]